MKNVLHKFSNLARWQERAHVLYPQLPEIDASTQPDNEVVIAQLIRFYISYLLPDNGLFPENLDSLIYANDDEFRNILAERLTTEDPLGQHAPKYMRHKATNIQATYWMSLRHLAVSLIEEAHARTIAYAKKRHTTSYESIIKEILAQQFMAYDYLAAVSKDFAGVDFNQIESDEIDANKEMFSAIRPLLDAAAARTGIEFGGDLAAIHREITSIWGMVTSNNPLVTPDFNYRTYSMRVPGASRALFPYPVLPMHAHSSRFANYVTYAEVPQASSINGTDVRSFGFLNSVLFDRHTGEALIVERPHYMYSTDIMRVAAEIPEAFEDIFTLDEKSRQNHDLLHHLVQIFAEHFQIHHPAAPISRGGYQRAYYEFGCAMRAHKETYELAATAGQAALFSANKNDENAPDLLQHEILLVRKTWKAVKTVEAHLINAGRKDEAIRFVDYICRAIMGPEFFIMGPETPERSELEEKINSLNPTPAIVRLHDVVGLLDSQRLLDVSLAAKLSIIETALERNPDANQLPNVLNWKKTQQESLKYAEFVNGAFYSILPLCHKEQLAQLYATLNPHKAYPECEFGAEIIYATLQEFGLDKPADAFPVKLNGAHAVRWNLLGGKAKPGYTGLGEKAHHMDEAPFGTNRHASVFDMILNQYAVLQENSDAYNQRIHLHRASQRAAHAILGLFSFTHESEENILPKIVKAAYEKGDATQSIGAAVRILDELVDHIFNDRFSEFTDDQRMAFTFFQQVVAGQTLPSNQKERFIEQLKAARGLYEEFQNALLLTCQCRPIMQPEFAGHVITYG